jgi:hypothetical protein
MKRLLSGHLSRRARATCSAALLLAAVACGGNDSSSTAPGGCQIITGTTTTSFSAQGGSSSIGISVRGSNCAWTAVSSAAFLTVTQGASGVGDGVVQFTVAPNTGPQRSATLTITGTAITITQSAP